jgi:hypothetical protein
MSDETERLRARPLCPSVELMSGFLEALLAAALAGQPRMSSPSMRLRTRFCPGRLACSGASRRAPSALRGLVSWMSGEKRNPDVMVDRAGPSRNKNVDEPRLTNPRRTTTMLPQKPQTLDRRRAAL